MQIFDVLKTANIRSTIKKPQSFNSTIKNNIPTNTSIILSKKTLRDFFNHHQNQNHDFNFKKDKHTHFCFSRKTDPLSKDAILNYKKGNFKTGVCQLSDIPFPTFV